MKQMVALLVIGLSSAAFGTSKAYDVVPYSNCVAETPHNTPVWQYYRNTLDSITQASVWIGDTIDTMWYNVDVVDSASPSSIIAYNHGYRLHKNWSCNGRGTLPIFTAAVTSPVSQINSGHITEIGYGFVTTLPTPSSCRATTT